MTSLQVAYVILKCTHHWTTHKIIYFICYPLFQYVHISIGKHLCEKQRKIVNEQTKLEIWLKWGHSWPRLGQIKNDWISVYTIFKSSRDWKAEQIEAGELHSSEHYSESEWFEWISIANFSCVDGCESCILVAFLERLSADNWQPPIASEILLRQTKIATRKEWRKSERLPD